MKLNTFFELFQQFVFIFIRIIIFIDCTINFTCLLKFILAVLYVYARKAHSLCTAGDDENFLLI